MEEGDAVVDLPSVPSLFNEGEAAKVFSQVLAQWLIGAQAQQQALETLANVFSSPTLSGSKNERHVFSATLPMLSAMANSQISAIEEQLGENLVAALPSLDGSMDKLQLLQLRALHCLNNALIGASSPEFFAPLTGTLWTSLLDRLREASDALTGPSVGNGAAAAATSVSHDDDELLDGLAAVVWSLARVSGANVPALPAHIGVIAGVISRRLSQAATVSCAGALGALAPLIIRDAAALKNAGMVLQQCCSSSSSSLLLVEACNSLVDLFADDSAHGVFVAINVASTLSNALPQMRKASTLLADDEVERVAEIASNVQAFLQYKKNN